MWRETTKHDRNMKIFREEIDDFLPGNVLDFHVHILNRESVPPDIHPNSAGQPIEKYDFDDLARDLRDAYPGRRTAAVCFGMPNVRYDKSSSDDYVAAGCNNQDLFGLMLFDPSRDTPETLAKALGSKHFLGIKPYLNYVRKPDPNLVEVDEMLPPWAMEVVAEHAAIVMLHIPRKLRLADPLNQAQVHRLCQRYPKAKIVLAHIGRAYFLKNVVGHLADLAALPNLYIDIAMLNNWEVLEHAFATADPGRILYATDTPIALAPGKSVEINDQYTYVTPVPWELSISDDHGKLVFTSFLYEELRAVRKAAERLGLGRVFLEDLFWNNGMRLLQSTLQA